MASMLAEAAVLRRDMADGADGSQLVGRKPSAQMDIKPDTAIAAILPQLTVGMAAAEVVASG